LILLSKSKPLNLVNYYMVSNSEPPTPNFVLIFFIFFPILLHHYLHNIHHLHKEKPINLKIKTHKFSFFKQNQNSRACKLISHHHLSYYFSFFFVPKIQQSLFSPFCCFFNFNIQWRSYESEFKQTIGFTLQIHNTRFILKIHILY
jgi:hypothetical protein